MASDGGIFAFGNAKFRGSMGATKLNKPVVGMVRYGTGYLMVGADGGIFSFSDKPFVGFAGCQPAGPPHRLRCHPRHLTNRPTVQGPRCGSPQRGPWLPPSRRGAVIPSLVPLTTRLRRRLAAAMAVAVTAVLPLATPAAPTAQAARPLRPGGGGQRLLDGGVRRRHLLLR